MAMPVLMTLVISSCISAYLSLTQFEKVDESSKWKRGMSKIYKLTVVSNHVARRECDRGTVSDFANEDLNEQMTRREAKIDIQEVVLL